MALTRLPDGQDVRQATERGWIETVGRGHTAPSVRTGLLIRDRIYVCDKKEKYPDLVEELKGE